MSVALSKISESVSGLGRAVANAQSSTKSISSTIKRSNTFKRSSMRISQSTFLKRREAVRRREQESIIEASSLSGAARRSSSVASGSTKGFMGRIMDFIGSLLVAWAIKNIPIIVNVVKQVIDRIQRTMTVLNQFVTNTGNFLLGFGNVLGAILSNIATFDFFDSQGKVSTAVDEMRNSFDLMEGNIRSAFDILSEPLDFSPLDGVFLEEDEEPGAEEPSPTEAPPLTGPGPGISYVSQGGTKITDPGGKDYGTYIPGGMGSRGSARVHGADGKQRGHTGEDYAMPIGKPLTMIAKGTVVDVQTTESGGGGYGKFVVVQLDNGMYVKMAHLDKVYVRKGQRVGAGSGPNGTAVVIGTSGNTGLSSGPHLHLDYSKQYNPATAASSQTMNPKGFIEGGGLVIGSNVRATGQTQTAPPSRSGTSQSQASSGSSSGGGSYGEKSLISALDRSGFTDRTERAMFLAQMAHESGNFRYDEEIASGADYEGRRDLGNTQRGDGKRYKGRGYIQLTGRANYRNYGNKIGVDLENNPELAKRPDIAAAIAIAYWNSRVNRDAARRGDVRTVTYNINGGYNGLSDREAKFKKYMNSAPSANVASSISIPNLQAPKGNNTISVPMPAQQQQASGGGSSGGGIMDTLSNAGQALNRLITQRFLTNL